MSDPSNRRERYTNDELAILIESLGASLKDGLLAIRTAMDGFLLAKVYEADKAAVTTEVASLRAEVAEAKTLARFCLTGVVTLIAAVLTLAILLASR